MGDRVMGIDWGKSEVKISVGDQEVASGAGVTVNYVSDFDPLPSKGIIEISGKSFASFSVDATQQFKDLQNKRRLSQLAHQAHLVKKTASK